MALYPEFENVRDVPSKRAKVSGDFLSKALVHQKLGLPTIVSRDLTYLGITRQLDRSPDQDEP